MTGGKSPRKAKSPMRTSPSPQQVHHGPSTTPAKAWSSSNTPTTSEEILQRLNKVVSGAGGEFKGNLLDVVLQDIEGMYIVWYPHISVQ